MAYLFKTIDKRNFINSFLLIIFKYYVKYCIIKER